MFLLSFFVLFFLQYRTHSHLPLKFSGTITSLLNPPNSHPVLLRHCNYWIIDGSYWITCFKTISLDTSAGSEYSNREKKARRFLGLMQNMSRCTFTPAYEFRSNSSGSSEWFKALNDSSVAVLSWSPRALQRMMSTVRTEGRVPLLRSANLLRSDLVFFLNPGLE